MTSTYPIKFTAQLRQHLRALRKKRGLTQAQLGLLVGVSQARIAEVEANPGLVSFDQLMQLLSALDVTVSLNEIPSVSVPQEQMNRNTEVHRAAEQKSTYTAANSTTEQIRETPNSLSEFSKPQDFLANTKKGSW